MISHISHYFVLFGLLAITVGGFWFFSWDKAFQVSIAIAMVASYVAWGVVHHWLHDDLYLEVVVEYLGIAVLGSVLAITLLL